MIKKLVFSLLWSGGVFCLLLIPMPFVAPIIIKWFGPVDEHTSAGVRFTYSLIPIAILVAPAMVFVLGLLGRLPGTKIEPHRK